jgi:hypothetical protein
VQSGSAFGGVKRALLVPPLMSHLPGLPMVAGVAMGIGAMSAVMLSLPLTSVLLAAILLPSDALAMTPLVIVAVVVAYVASARIVPKDTATPAPQAQPAATAGTATNARAPGPSQLPQ